MITNETRSQAADAHAVEPFEPCVLLPSYNNAGTLIGVLEQSALLGVDMFVINDGSTDRTAQLLEQWCATAAGKQTHVLTHKRNRGKAAALATGFAAATKQGKTHAVTMDTDGQLDPHDASKLLEVSKHKPHALVLGRRAEKIENYPDHCRFGRLISNLFIRIECGRVLSDTQCGLRVYPLKLIEFTGCRSGRFAFEAEVITRSVWAGADVIEVPVTCRYLDATLRVSHFKPWIDTLRGTRLHLALMARAAFPWPHRRGWNHHHKHHMPRTTLVELLQWLNPLRTWRDLKNEPANRNLISAGIAIGVLMANLPLYGLHTVLCLYIARRWHLPVAAVVAGSLLSTPPIGPLLIALAVYVGSLAQGHSPYVLLNQLQSAHSWTSFSLEFLLSWVIGSLIVGPILMVITFFASLAFFNRMPVVMQKGS